MNKRKIIALTIVATLATSVIPTNIAFAMDTNSEVSKDKVEEGTKSEYNVSVNQFNMTSLENYNDYEKAFKVTGIKSYSNNGGVYASSTLNKAFDGNLSTHWETGRPNSSAFTNEVIVTFENVETINRIVYGARKDAGNKGFANKFSIYSSLTDDENDFKLVGKGQATKGSGLYEFKFNKTEFKRLKFVFDESYDSWSSANEFMFFKEDIVEDNINNIFVDGTHVKLSDKYNNIELLENFEKEVNNHPLASKYINIIQEAKDLYNNPNKYEDALILTASQRGDVSKEAREHQITRASYSLDTFGKYVTPGETIKLYVDADEKGVMPQLLLGQLANDKNDWRRFYTLKPGLNTIKAPEFSNMSPAVIYIYNPALPSDQAYAPKVRLVGGTKFPVYYHGKTDPAEYERELEEYTKKISINDNDFANGLREDILYNVTELISENNTITTSAAGALQGIKEIKSSGKTVADTMNDWEKMWHEFQKFSGFVENDPDPRNDLYNVKFTSRVFTKGPYGWSDWGYTGYNGENAPRRDTGVFKHIVKPFALNDDWLFFHEWGHNINNSWTEHSEVTNNLYSAQMRKVFGTGGDAIDWTTLYSRFSGNTFNHGYFTNLGVLSQPLYYYGSDLYGKASRIARTNPNGVLNGLSNNQQRFVIAYSLASGYDLTDFFNDWNYVKTTDVMKAKVSHLSKPSVKLEYMNSSGVGYEGKGFTENTVASIDSIVTNSINNTNKLSFSIDEASKSAAMGYEIFRDGKLVGYTTSTSFEDKNIDPSENYKYELVVYDKKLKPSKKVSRMTITPNLKVDDGIVININDSFDFKDYISVLDNKGSDLKEKVKLVSSNLDTTKRGKYTLEIEVENSGVVVKDSMNVTVVSESTYLSDMDWKSSQAGYGSIKKDKSHGNSSILLTDNITKREYKKGIGMHAISEVVVDIEGKGFETFESYIGADGNSTAPQTSVNFQVFVDGEIKYDSGRMTVDTAKKHISLNVAGAKEVKLLMSDSGNGISNDSGVWADTKFTRNSTKPVITAENTTYLKLRDKLDLMDGVSAKDIEDGDITSNIVINNGGFDNNKTGEYDVIYTVTDSEENTTTLNRKVIVWSESQYISNINWESANTSYGQVRKDLASGGAKIKLSIDGEEKVFDKGIGTHANSEIVYNLEGTNYEYFESYVGVDRNIAQQGNSSVIFKIFADDKEVYNSGLMKWNDEAKFVRIPVKGASKVKLIVNDAGNGISSDHANFGDAKFLITNSKPTLVIPKAISTKLGVPIDLKSETYTANDSEDGDITSKVIVSGDVNFNKTGKYNLTYSVTDSNGNTTTAIREVFVTDMEDYKYLSDINWKSATASWGQVNKDLSVSGNALRLTGEDGSLVKYNKGIGTHSTSNIIYDLKDGNYTNFSTYIGVDRQMYNTVGSVIFQIWLDGQKAYDSGVMRSTDKQKFVELNITGVKEMKLVVTDGGNGNGSDHADFGDSKLYYANDNGVEVNREKLDSIVDNINKLNKESYKAEAWDNIQATLKEVKDSLLDGYNQKEVDALYNKLKSGYEALVNTTDYTELEKLVEAANKINKETYTEESVKVLEGSILKANTILSNKKSLQEEVNKVASELKNAIDNLQDKINLKEVVNISDSYLKKAIKSTLNISTDDITIEDMYKLTRLTDNSGRITSLEGLQYAKNLESLNLDYNEITNISPLKNLSKLKNISIVESYIAVGMAKEINGKVVIKEDVVDINGEKLVPKEITLGGKSGEVELDVASNMENGNISIDISNFKNDVASIILSYEGANGNFKPTTLYMFKK
ncbi:hypothetical protein JCM1393_05380 [Clostridium carnis]